MEKKIDIIIVDDNLVFIEGLVSLLKKDPRFNIIDKLSSGKKLLESNKILRADIILMDIEMPELNGIEAAKRVNFINHNIKLIAITMYQDRVYLQQLIESGFRGFVNKAEVANKLFTVIDEVMQNRFMYPENIKIYK